MAKRRTLTKNKELFDKAKRYLVGGVDSPVRNFSYVGMDPVLIEHGLGSKVYDHDGNRYIDYVMGWGAVMLGHADQLVTKDLKLAVNSGLGFGTTNDTEVELAKEIHDAIPFVEKVRFVSSGTEAVMGAIRLARGYTGRDKIVKLENSYHGHADYLLAKGGSGLATLNMPSSAGVPKDFIKHTLVAPPDDITAIENIFKKDGGRIAAVIIEPVGGNYGVVPRDADYLKKLRRITKKYGALLIFDEVITGFRFNFGSSAERPGITPDIICLGKIIGGGLPIGAYGGRRGIMRRLAPSGDVYQASTFSGNPVVMRSGLATLRILKKRKNEYSDIEHLTRFLVRSLEKEAYLAGADVDIGYFGNIFSIRFKDRKLFSRFYRKMLEGGIYLAPSEYEANFLSFAHSADDIKKTIGIAKLAFAGLSEDQKKWQMKI